MFNTTTPVAKNTFSGTGSFSGDLNIGTATITNTGSLVGTNAILFNHFISQSHQYLGIDPQISKIDNILYDYSSRFTTTSVTNPDSSMAIDILIPPDEIHSGNLGLVYPQGSIYFSFWSGASPQSISVQVKDTSNIWRGPYTAGANLSTNGFGLFRVGIPAGFNCLKEIKINMTIVPLVKINLQNIEYVLDNPQVGLLSPFPFVGKYDDEHLYRYFFLKSKGVDNIRLAPYKDSSSYFMYNLLVGTKTDNGNKLQVTGNVTATGSVGIGTATPAAQLHTTGSVRFAGLTSDTTKTRVIVSDASGNLFYRDASTLAGNGLLNSSLANRDTVRSSLAVNGTISAQRLRLSQTGWPDYVFDSSYRLPSLDQLEKYIRQHNHLPGIADAKEAESKGIDVGDHQAALLKKIEELTLYAIGQDKKLQMQSEQIDALKRKNEELDSLKQDMIALKKMISYKSEK
jgi:hypothetical protein